jgi:hypothetical protein
MIDSKRNRDFMIRAFNFILKEKPVNKNPIVEKDVLVKYNT